MPHPSLEIKPAPLPADLPDGFRPMTAAESDVLDTTHSMLVYDRLTKRVSRYRVLGYSTNWGWRVGVVQRGEVMDDLWLDDDNPDYWPEGESREQRGPMSVNGRLVAVMPIDLADMRPLLRASLYAPVAREALDEAREIAEQAAGEIETCVHGERLGHACEYCLASEDR